MAKAKKTEKTKTVAIKPAKKMVPKTAKIKSQKTGEKLKILHHCSFCGKIASQERYLIAVPNNIFICEKCTEICVRIFFDGKPLEWRLILNDILAQSKIAAKSSERKKKK